MSAAVRFLSTIAAGWCLLAAPDPATAQTSAASGDSVRAGGALLRDLQNADDAFYLEELFQFDPAFRDSAVARLDSLGFEAFEDQQNARPRSFRIGFVLSEHLTDFNRVEGLVGGGGLEVHPLGQGGLSLRGEAGYATASEEFRHYEQLQVPLFQTRSTRIQAVVSYGDRARPFGANHPAAGGLRALAGGSDDRHYLRSRGGAARFQIRHDHGLRVGFGYEAARESPLEVATDFAIIGRMPGSNAAASEGIDRAAVVTARYGLLGDDGAQAGIAYRVAGGALGGDFAYQRAELNLLTRRYLGRQEFLLDARAVVTGDGAPGQRLADLGGYDSIRGFPGRMRVGESSLAGRLEYHVPYDLLARTGIPYVRSLHLQLVPWADAGRVWEGNASTWITSGGLGLQYYLGPFERVTHIRLDLAFPLGPDRTDDVQVLLGFSRGLF